MSLRPLDDTPVQSAVVRARAGLVRLLGYAGLGCFAWFVRSKDYRRAVATCVALTLLGTYQRGVKQSFLWALFGVGKKPTCSFSGDGCAPGYEEVGRIFKRNFEDGMQLGAQCVAYVGGRKVVDVCGTRSDLERMRGYNPETRQNVFSSSKCLTSLAVAMLVEKGHLRYDQTIASVWPEFAKHGKDKITVAELMRHEAGLATFDRTLCLADLTTERIQAHAVSDIIADQKPKWSPKTRREYHAITRGWIVNELFIRCDPKGRTVGQFVRQEILAPLNLGEGFVFGLHDANNIANLEQTSRWWSVVHGLVPNCLGSKLPPPLWLLMLFWFFMGREKIPAFALANKRKGAPFIFNDPEMRAAEAPSANGHANARAIARIAACVAANCRGEAFEGVTLLTKNGADGAHGAAVVLPMFGSKSKFTNAGWNIFELPDGMIDGQGSVGWMGWGGSVMQWHRGLGVGFGYCGNLMSEDAGNSMGFELHRAVLKCATKLQTA